MVLRSFAFPGNGGRCIRNRFYGKSCRRFAIFADGIITAAGYNQREFRLFGLTGRTAIGVLNQVIRVCCGIERRGRIGASRRYFHLNKQVTSLVCVRGGEIDSQFSIRYRQSAVIHLGKRASVRGRGPISRGILKVGVTRLGERYFELSLTPRLSLIGGVESQCLDFTAYSDAFELVS